MCLQELLKTSSGLSREPSPGCDEQWKRITIPRKKEISTEYNKSGIRSHQLPELEKFTNQSTTIIGIGGWFNHCLATLHTLINCVRLQLEI
jgi:hypothetical protein